MHPLRKRKIEFWEMQIPKLARRDVVGCGKGVMHDKTNDMMSKFNNINNKISTSKRAQSYVAAPKWQNRKLS